MLICESWGRRSSSRYPRFIDRFSYSAVSLPGRWVSSSLIGGRFLTKTWHWKLWRTWYIVTICCLWNEIYNWVQPILAFSLQSPESDCVVYTQLVLMADFFLSALLGIQHRWIPWNYVICWYSIFLASQETFPDHASTDWGVLKVKRSHDQRGNTGKWK